MKREELEFILESNECLAEGTKEACIKAREFLHHATNQGNQIHAAVSCVTAEEFVEAVKTLMAFAFQQEDTVPERWRCDNDCQRVSDLLCPGECNISKKAEKLCPFFMDEGLI